jgi:putative DNA primase/helicase
MADKPRSIWTPILPIPDDVPVARVRHPTRGEPLRVFFYQDAEGRPLGRMCRFTTSSGEAVHLPLTWCQDQDGIRGWRWIQFQRFRPLFGLEHLAESAADPVGLVVIVFDEYEADWARKLLPPKVCVVSWPGGLRKIDEVDWSPLRGLNVLIWPLRTMERAKVARGGEGSGAVLPRERQPGWQAALKLEKIVLSFGGTIFGIVDPFSAEEVPDGFGPAMVGLQNWDEKRVWDWMFDHGVKGRGSDLEQRVRKIKGEQVPSDPPAGEMSSAQDDETWHLRLLTKHGEVVPCLSNVHDILANSELWRGVIAFDEFAQRVVKLKAPVYIGGVAGEWESTDDSRTAMMLSRLFKFTPSSALVTEAVEVIARENGFHPVRRWLRGLKWDGVARLDDWLDDYLGVAKTEYSMRVSRWYLMGMIARVMVPGKKFDYCLVLEGVQGRLKSSALAVLGGEWFGDTDINLDNKDSMSALRGKWLYEFQEMGSLAKHEASKQKSFISRQVDEFRPVYGRREIRCPRQVVFAGTTNDWEWNKDPTGGRRFWPVAVDNDVHVEGLREAREQLFAEALVRFEAGERYWPTSAEQREFFDPEQLKREQQDSLVDALHDWVYQQFKEFSIATAAMDGLKMDASKLTRDLQTRIGISLRKLGCAKVEKRNGMTRFWYKPPEKTAKSESSMPAQQPTGDEHDAF